MLKDAWYDADAKTWKEGKKYLQVSTDEVYGALGAEGYFMETTPLCPHSSYSASKASADMFVKAFHDTYGMPINKNFRVADAAVNVTFGSKVDDVIRVIFGDQVSDKSLIADITLNKDMAGIVLDIFQVFQVAGMVSLSRLTKRISWYFSSI